MLARARFLVVAAVLAGTVFAADKPAVEARQKMEAAPPVVVVEHGHVPTVRATKPAVKAQETRREVRGLTYTREGHEVIGKGTTKPAAEARTVRAQ